MTKNKKLLMIIGLVLLLITGGFVGKNIVQSNTISKSIDLGNKYLSEQNYTEAILEFEKALKIDSKNTDITGTLDILYAYNNILDLISKDKLDEAKIEIDKLKDHPKFEIINSSIESIQAEVDEKLAANLENLINNKFSSLDGYWASNNSIYQFEKDSDSYSVFSLANEMHFVNMKYPINNITYDNDTDSINIETSDSDSLSVTQNLKIIDDNTIELTLGDYKQTLHRKTQKEAVMLYYGKALTTSDLFYINSLYDTLTYRDSILNVYNIEAFEYMVAPKGNFTAEEAIDIISNGISKENYLATEVNILPGIKSYSIDDITNPVASATQYIFEGGLSTLDIRDNYINHIQQ